MAKRNHSKLGSKGPVHRIMGGGMDHRMADLRPPLMEGTAPQMVDMTVNQSSLYLLAIIVGGFILYGIVMR